MTARIHELAAELTGPDWRQSLREAVRDTGELASLLELPVDMPELAAASDFPLLVPRGFVARMRKGDPFDPLLRQVLPTTAELRPQQGYSSDPLAEQALAQSGSISKYPGRALLITTAACPVHCRYCFRRDFPYSAQTAARNNWQPALDSIRQDPNISEIILSGGDPLSLGNRQLGEAIEAIEDLPQLTTLRIHTRFPIMLPERIDTGLIELLASTRLETVVVVHANHPAEIDASVERAAEGLRQNTNYLLNQSVLLRGINDTVATLIALSERLRNCGIVPYYLHLLDRVRGAAHFEVDEATAVELVAQMRARIPGYLVPTLVRDQPGELSKTTVS